MKRFAQSLAVFALFAFAACDDKPNETPDTKIAGTYNGYSYSKSAMQAYPWSADDETLTITANSDNTASLTFNSKGEWGSYIIEELSFAKDDDYYIVSGSGKLSLGGTGGSQSNDYEFTMTGIIKSNTDATFVFVASVGEMGDVTTTFVTGSMPDAFKIVGEYEGYTTTLDILTADETLTITENGDGTVNLDFTSENWGAYSLKNLTVGNSDGVYTIEGSGKVSLEISPEPSKEYDFTVTGTIRSKDDATFVFVASVGEMGDVTTIFVTGLMPAFKIAGTYEGYTISNSKTFTDMITEDEVLTLIANDDGTVNLDFTSNDWGTFFLENIPVGNNGGVYTIEGAGKWSIYDFTMSGNIISFSDAEITFTMPTIMGGSTAKFVTGTAPVEETP